MSVRNKTQTSDNRLTPAEDELETPLINADTLSDKDHLTGRTIPSTSSSGGDVEQHSAAQNLESGILKTVINYLKLGQININNDLTPTELLLESVKKNDLETIENLIKDNKALLSDKHPYTGKTILSTACSEEGIQPSTIEILIALGADLEGDAENKPVHLAAQNPKSDILKTVIKHLKPGQINDTVDGNTPLLSLVKCLKIEENDEIFCENIKLLLKNGANVNQSDRKNLSAIFWAAKHGYKNAIKTILEESVHHVDLDTHQLQNQSARDLIKKNDLYSGPLPEKILYEALEEKLFSLLKLSKEQEFIDYFDTSPLRHSINLDDGTSTILQYGCENGLSEVVKYLLKRDVNVNLTVRNNEKRPIELVAERGYYEIFQMLLDAPNVEIPSSVLFYIIKQSDAKKFPNINHEKCCKMLLKKLMLPEEPESNRKIIVDVNEEDTMKNTPLHYSLRYADEETSHKLLKLGASLASKNDFDIMPITDIKPELLEKHLDECVEFNVENKNYEKRDFEVTFNYRSLIPLRKMKNNNFDESDPEICVNFDNIGPETEVIAYMSQAPEFEALLKHPVIVSFLFMKWHKIRLLFYTNLSFCIFFVVSLMGYILTYYANFDRETPSDFCLALGKLSGFVLNLTFWIFVLRELFQITVSPKKYCTNFENYVEISLVVTTSMILYIRSLTNDTRKALASIVILLAAFELILMVGKHPKFSANVIMLITVSVTFFKSFLFYSPLIIAFSVSFNILFVKTKSPENINGTDADNVNKSFMGPSESVFKTIVMLAGELNANSIDFQINPIISQLVFSLFVFVIIIILLNLLNGLAVSDTQTIKNDAELLGHISRAQHLYFVENVLAGNILSTSVMKILQNLFRCFPCDRNMTYPFFKTLARKVRLFTHSGNYQLTVLPNNQRKSSSLITCTRFCSDSYLDKETVKRINSIVKSRRENGPLNTVENIYLEFDNLKKNQEQIIQLLGSTTTSTTDC
jgi:transient receptor potential cation channel subfamily A protein 1